MDADHGFMSVIYRQFTNRRFSIWDVLYIYNMVDLLHMFVSCTNLCNVIREVERRLEFLRWRVITPGKDLINYDSVYNILLLSDRKLVYVSVVEFVSHER